MAACNYFLYKLFKISTDFRNSFREYVKYKESYHNVALGLVTKYQDNILLVQSQQQKHYKKVWNMFKVNNKNTRATCL